MTLGTLVKRLENLMRPDTGIDGAAQRLSQIVWLLFLKVFDYKEEEAELEDDYKPVIPVGYRWRDWATCESERDQLTGDKLIQFVNTQLLPALRGEPIKGADGKDFVPFPQTDEKALLVKSFMQRTINYSANGVQLRLVINLFDEIDFSDSDETHEFNDIYETLLKELQAAGKAGEFYTPRALTSFGVKHVNPKLGEKVGDFACGTGGFLVDALRHLEAQVEPGDIEAAEGIQRSLTGIELKPMPYMLGVTNLMLHGIELPDITYGNAFTKRLIDYDEADMVDVVTMNPPYGGVATAADKASFPADLTSSETADLFMALIIARLNREGRAVVILPDGFLFGEDNAKINIKKKLLKECNLHTVIRLPQSCFAPYTSITTNMLFFDKTGSTQETWFYRFDMPEGYKHFSKTKPILPKHLEVVDEWWDNRTEIKDEDGDTYKARKFTAEEIAEGGYNLDLCGYPTVSEEVLPVDELIASYKAERERLDANIDDILAKLEETLGIEA